MGTGIETKPQMLWELPEGKYQGFCPVGAESWGYQLQSKLLNSWMLLGLECWNLSMHLGPRAWVGSWNLLGGHLEPPGWAPVPSACSWVPLPGWAPGPAELCPGLEGHDHHTREPWCLCRHRSSHVSRRCCTLKPPHTLSLHPWKVEIYV